MLFTAIVLTILVVAYFVLTTLVDLRPLNNITGATPIERRMEVVVNAPLMLIPALFLGLAGGLKLPCFGLVASALELVIAVAGLSLWWLPYLAGVSVPWATGDGGSWAELHERTYAKTIIILPRIGNRPRPNLEHMILHALIVAASVSGFIASANI